VRIPSSIPVAAASHSIKAQLIPVTSAIEVTGMMIAMDVVTTCATQIAHETDVVSP